jgi:hypothetical protein
MLRLVFKDEILCHVIFCYSCTLYDPQGDLSAMKMLQIRSCVMPKKCSGGNMTDLINNEQQK